MGPPGDDAGKTVWPIGLSFLRGISLERVTAINFMVRREVVIDLEIELFPVKVVACSLGGRGTRISLPPTKPTNRCAIQAVGKQRACWRPKVVGARHIPQQRVKNVPCRVQRRPV